MYPKISYIFDKILVLSIICSKCGNKNDRISKEEESIKIFQVLDLIKQKLHVHLIDMADRNIIKTFRLKNVDDARNYFTEEIKKMI